MISCNGLHRIKVGGSKAGMGHTNTVVRGEYYQNCAPKQETIYFVLRIEKFLSERHRLAQDWKALMQMDDPLVSFR